MGVRERHRRVHVVWSGSRFPYHGRLAIESALATMPEVVVDIHVVGDFSADDRLDRMARSARVSVVPFDPERGFAGCPGGPERYLDLLARIPEASASAVSNLVRLAVLFEHGGIYLDTDVLVVRPLDDPGRGCYVGSELVWSAYLDWLADGATFTNVVRAAPWATRWTARRIDAAVARGRLGVAGRLDERGSMRLKVNNAVIGACAGSEFVGRALERALGADPTVRFALGPTLLDDVAIDHPELVDVLPPSRFYAVPPGQSFRLFEDVTLDLPDDAQVVHYVASNHRRLLDELDEDHPAFEDRRGVFWSEARRVRRWARDRELIDFMARGIE